MLYTGYTKSLHFIGVSHLHRHSIIVIDCFQDVIDSVCRMMLYIFDSNSIPNFTTTSTQQEDAVAPNVIHVAFYTFIDIFLQYC